MSRMYLCSSFLLLSLLRVPLADAWALGLYRGPDLQETGDPEGERITEGVKACTNIGPLEPGQAPITGMFISQYGPLDGPDPYNPAEASGKWRDHLHYFGFWKTNNCGGLPNLIISFYDVDYTIQEFAFSKIRDYLDPQGRLRRTSGLALTTSFGDEDIGDFRSYGEIPYQIAYDNGLTNNIPEGSVAIRKDNVPEGAEAIKWDTFWVLGNAVAVEEVEPDSNSMNIIPTDEWEDTGYGGPGNVKTFALEGGRDNEFALLAQQQQQQPVANGNQGEVIDIPASREPGQWEDIEWGGEVQENPYNKMVGDLVINSMTEQEILALETEEMAQAIMLSLQDQEDQQKQQEAAQPKVILPEKANIKPPAPVVESEFTKNNRFIESYLRYWDAEQTKYLNELADFVRTEGIQPGPDSKSASLSGLSILPGSMIFGNSDIQAQEVGTNNVGGSSYNVQMTGNTETLPMANFNAVVAVENVKKRTRKKGTKKAEKTAPAPAGKPPVRKSPADDGWLIQQEMATRAWEKEIQDREREVRRIRRNRESNAGGTENAGDADGVPTPNGEGLNGGATNGDAGGANGANLG
ncbi:hypothetical protein H072_3900 [Dactylellina haptotyla CBS 200.50]|uniref:Uncharacterized protein n=1 Tax=Dactylellina haptotyla (strain CBS 200.50) TaxID=1284197 RepID=S8AM08_DACHA|nr:hypothetical protein H072_3900 [Dactylellina haptotyla CBS 200.50]